MSYASDLGLKVGSKIKVLSSSVYFKTGDIITLTEDDYTEIPWFRGGGRRREPFPIIDCQWEHYKEEEKGVTSATKVEFPCCVPTSEIKDAKTLLALVALFEANGATVYDGVACGGGHEFDRVNYWNYFGVSLRACGNTFGNTFRTDFYDDFEDYNQSEESSELTIYHVANLLGDNAIVASQEAITERLEDNPSVGIDYSVMGSTASTEPLITITQEVKYTVVIKGITFTFTQDEIDALAEELLGFTTL